MEMDDDVYMDAPDGSCVSCHRYDNEMECEFSDAKICKWKENSQQCKKDNDECKINVETGLLKTYPQCSEYMECNWDLEIEACVSCGLQGDKETCENIPFCLWKDFCYQDACFEHQEFEDACVNDIKNHCSMIAFPIAGKELCMSCKNFIEEWECDACEDCTWKGNCCELTIYEENYREKMGEIADNDELQERTIEEFFDDFSI